MDTGSVSSSFERLLAPQPAPPWWLVLVTAALALILVGYRPLWRITRAAVTVAHEGGHALFALLTGRRLHAITLHTDTSGLTVSSGKPTGPGMILTAMAGYPAPALLGVGYAALLGSGRVSVMLWATLAMLVAVLVKVRNVYGLLTVLVLGALVFGVSWYGSDLLQAGFAYLAAWFLLAAAVRPVLELQRGRRRQPGRTDSDADQLARLTHLPALLWVLFFALVCLAAAVIGGWLMLAPVEQLHPLFQR
ncbi:M50 family metallopeptidase [Nocardia coubleae]|uniref:M50 family metallopeptidase n=1 Tax=Nocardia coubleae TaxID=356147 RepID=A0A846W1I9_9NOCA|nr:M50 family metallopeptidase [Nocardia coubleae]NKX86680.1 M50 family metallopeptidase [Nocardia coubleae]